MISMEKENFIIKMAQILKSKRKKGNCFICGKVGHYAATCRARGNFNNNKNNNKGFTSNKTNVVQTEEIIAAVVCEAHLVTKVKGWVVDSACTRHIVHSKRSLVPTLVWQKAPNVSMLGTIGPCP